MKRTILGAALAVPLLLCAGPLRADDISEGLERARELYEKGDIAGAVTEVNFALNGLHQKRAAAYAALFPAAPQGWTLGEADDAAGNALAAQMLGGGVMVEREYTKGDEQVIKATVIVDSPLIQALGAMASNPAMMGAGARRIRIGNDNAILQRESGSEDAEMTLVRGNVAVKLEATGVKDNDTLTALIKRFDLARLSNLSGR
ncbi:hypothetical protein ACFOD4_14665 [Pseudoroseomonas globiformis]|uniref:Uncharacterized protein n=1 Tax=Teichococcus globiformis TaxID=2307229 RepID=A0ABV7G5L1_9PROT